MKGFSLVEIIITIAIFIIILGGIYGFVSGLYRANNFTFMQALAVSEARKGIGTITREIRESQIGEDGSYLIEKADDYEFIFYSDIDKDNQTERVRYFVEGSDFYKGVINPENGVYITEEDDPDFNEKIVILSKYIRNEPPIFRYFDSELNELPAPARLNETTLMKLKIIINVDPEKPPYNFTLENYIALRNIK